MEWREWKPFNHVNGTSFPLNRRPPGGVVAIPPPPSQVFWERYLRRDRKNWNRWREQINNRPFKIYQNQPRKYSRLCRSKYFQQILFLELKHVRIDITMSGTPCKLVTNQSIDWILLAVVSLTSVVYLPWIQCIYPSNVGRIREL